MVMHKSCLSKRIDGRQGKRKKNDCCLTLQAGEGRFLARALNVVIDNGVKSQFLR